MMMLYARIFPIELAIPVGAGEFPAGRNGGRHVTQPRRSGFRLAWTQGVFA